MAKGYISITEPIHILENEIILGGENWSEIMKTLASGEGGGNLIVSTRHRAFWQN